MHYDAIIIGCGSGGYEAAIQCANLGGKTAVVESDDFGGTCVNRGCIPSKVWQKAASIWESFSESETFGIKVSEKTINYKKVVERKNNVSRDIRMGMEGMLAGSGVDIIKGKGVITEPGRVKVDNAVYEARNVIIATGSSLFIPEIPGLDDALYTSDRILDMEHPPKSVLIYGGGYVEAEMACLLNTFGVRVILAAKSKRILEMEDHDTSQRLVQALKDKQIKVITNASFDSVKKAGDGYKCVFNGHEEDAHLVEKILICSRKPNVSGLGLKSLGIELNDDGGIKVNDFLETSVKGIFAVGDATGGWMLSHAASSMAAVAAKNAMGGQSKYPFRLIPRGVFTTPEIGAVGLSEEEAEKMGYDVEIGSFPYSINGLAMCRNELDGAVKIVADATYGEILGVHIVGSQATELINEAVVAMLLEATVQEFAGSVTVHPTFSETLVQAARGVDI